MPKKLYHGTGVYELAQIVASGFLELSADDDHDDSGIAGVSLTSDPDVANKFADEAKDRDWEKVWNSPVDDGVVIHLDGSRLSADIGLTSVTWDGSRSEKEYRTHGRVFDPLRYVDKIVMDFDALAWWMRELADVEEVELAQALYDIPARYVMPKGGGKLAVEAGLTIGTLLDGVSRPASPVPAGRVRGG